MSFHEDYPLTTGYTTIDKNVLVTARLHESWSDAVVTAVATNPDNGREYPITIIECRVEFDDFAKTVIRTPGSGYPGDCNGWTEGSVSILSKEMKILDVDNDTTRVIPGVSYPVITSAGSMGFTGAYTKVLFPCDRIEYLDDNTTDANVVTSHPYADEEGLENVYDNIPQSYDHLTEFRPDPTHDVTLTYHIHVVYQGGTEPGDPAVPDDPNTPEDETDPGTPGITIPDGYEIHTVTQKVLNNPDDNVKILKYLLTKEIGVEAQQAKYGFGDKDPNYEEYKIPEVVTE